MASMRPIFVALTLLPTVACGGGDDGDGGTIVPEGPHHAYVASTVSVPTNATEARNFGLDIGASKNDDPDGTVDNQLGMVLGTLANQGFKVQDAITTSVNDGSIILLVDFQSAAFDASNAAGLALKLGANPMPAPCTDPADPTTCGQHLKGTGTFTVDPSSPNNVAVAGKIVGGTFNGGPGTLSLQLSLGGAALTLDLHSARAKASGITDAGMTSLILAGALTKTDLDSKVLPAIQSQLPPLIERDCTVLDMPPDCGCAAGSTGKTILGLFDAEPKDCMVSLDEIKANTLIQSLLSPDVCTQASCDTPDALSLGIKATAVKGTFPTE